MDDLVAALQDVFGAGQPAVPRLMIDAATLAAAVPGLAAGDRFLAAAPDLAADWLDDSAAVRTNTGLLVNAAAGLRRAERRGRTGRRLADPRPARRYVRQQIRHPAGLDGDPGRRDLARIAPAETLVVRAAGPSRRSRAARWPVCWWTPGSRWCRRRRRQRRSPTRPMRPRPARRRQSCSVLPPTSRRDGAPTWSPTWRWRRCAGHASDCGRRDRGLAGADAASGRAAGRRRCGRDRRAGPAAAAGRPCPAGRGPGEQQGAWLMGRSSTTGWRPAPAAPTCCPVCTPASTTLCGCWPVSGSWGSWTARTAAPR